MPTKWSCGCKAWGVHGDLRAYCPQHQDWACHGGPVDHLQPLYQPNLGSCPICFHEARVRFTLANQ